MNRISALLFPLLATSLLCCAVQAATPELIARGGNIELGPDEVRQLVAALPDASRTAAASDLATLEQVLRGEIARRALLDEARSAGFERDPDTRTQLDSVRDEALLRLWIASRARLPDSYPSAEELQAAYEANKARLTPGAGYHLAQIFIAAPDGADAPKLSEALRKAADVGAKLAGPGADFAKLATQYSDHADSAAHGGDLGLLPEGRLLPEVAAAVTNLRAGEIAGPIKTAQGLHFVKVLEIKPAQVPTLAEVRTQLREALRVQRIQQLQQAYIDEARRKLGIVVNQVELARLQQSLR